MILHLLELSRLHLFLVGATSSLVFGYALTGQFQWNMMWIVMLDWFIVNFCNNATDWKEDSVNNVSYSSTAKKNHNTIVIFSALVTFISFLPHFWFLPCLFGPRVLGHALGILYNFPVLPGHKRLKQIYPLKNAASCLGFLITLFLYPLSCYDLAPGVNIWNVVGLLGFFIPLEIAFEIIYDLRDLPGDRAAEVHSFPVVCGSAWAKRAVIILDLVSIVSMFGALGFDFLEWKHGVMVFGALLHLSVFFYLNHLDFHPSHVIIITWSFVLCQITYVLWILFGLPSTASYFLGEITPIKIIDISMVLIGILTTWWSKQFFSLPQFILAYLSIALAGGLCENSVIILYDFYWYNERVWTVMAGVMPLEVTLIWPQVIFTTYRLMKESFGLQSWKLAFIGSMEVFGLAYFVEICCVSRGFWSWSKSNFAGVPIIGVLGWAFFAFCALIALYQLEKGNVWAIVSLPVYSVLVVHSGVLLLWYCGFWYISDIEIPVSYVAFGSLVSLPVLLIQIRHLRNKIQITVVQEFPRICAALVLSYTLLRGNPPLELLVLTAVLLIPFLGCLSLGWPAFLLAERDENIRSSTKTS